MRTDDSLQENSVRSVNSAHSVRSARSVHSVTRDTLPETLTAWRTSLFKFTRALKFDCGMDGAPMAEVRQLVEEWYGCAKPVIGTVPFFEVWSEFATAWDRARHPAFQDPLQAALAKVRGEAGVPPLPEVAGYDDPLVALAYRLLFWLALSNRDHFFISCRALGECLGVDHVRAWRLLRMFEVDGVIECLKRGRMPKASRYLWIGIVLRAAQR